MILYVNAVEIGRTNYIGSGLLINTDKPMYIGRDGDPSVKKFKGELDEIRIYNKALTQTELLNQLCTQLAGNEDGLVAYYNFNNISSTSNNTIVPNMATSTSGLYPGRLKSTGTGGADVTFPKAGITCPKGNVSNNTSCDPGNPNGKINVAGQVTPSGNYDYSIYRGFNTTDLIETNKTGLFIDLEEGFYTLTAKDETTNCITIPSTVSVSTVEDIPSIVSETADDTGCDAIGNGTIKITTYSATVEPAAGYTYEIFQGASFATEMTEYGCSSL